MTNCDATHEKIQHFQGTHDQLQRVVSLTGIAGIWRDLNHHVQKQFVAENGAILNFWPSTMRIYFQGSSEGKRRAAE